MPLSLRSDVTGSEHLDWKMDAELVRFTSLPHHRVSEVRQIRLSTQVNSYVFEGSRLGSRQAVSGIRARVSHE